jgi:two-component system sensor histidine kinase RpfC
VHRYQAAILDISMPPGMSGPEVIRRYRLRRPHSRLPMIVLTANDSRESQIAAADAGADAFLSKPVSAESLRATLEQLLAVSANQAESGAAEAEPELPTIDWSVLAEIERLYTSEAEVTRLIAAFSADASKRVAEIRQAAAGHNRAALCAAAQALKSLAAGIGASRLTEGARRIEELPRLPSEASMAALIEQLQSSLSDVIAMLSGLRR